MIAFAQEGQSSIANPASVYCVDHGGKSKIMTNPDGSQFGMCIFPDNSQCEEWQYFRGDCNPGQIFESPTNDTNQQPSDNYTSTSFHRTMWLTIWSDDTDVHSHFSPANLTAYVGDEIAIGNADYSHMLVSGSPETGPDGKINTVISHGTVFRKLLTENDLGIIHLYDQANPRLMTTIIVKPAPLNSTIPEFSSTVSVILVISVFAAIFVSRMRL